MSDDGLVLVTGATGYIGGRLVPELLDAGYKVRALARHPERLDDRDWRDRVEVVQADASEADDLRAAMAGVDVAYYLIHALGTGSRFESRDRQTARAFGVAARQAGVRRIVYLGGLYPADEQLSPHLDSRREVGEILLASGVPTTVLRAAVILGSGSASFEMLRYLTERLPVMVAPKWLKNRIQPIAVRDVLRYLVGSASMPAEVNRGFDIGGPDVLTYQDMMQRYAAVARLPRRQVMPVPVLTPSLSGHWVGLVTPVPNGIARPLVESLIHEVVCKEHDIARYVPDPDGGLLGFDDAVEQALRRVREGDVEVAPAGEAGDQLPSDPQPGDPEWAGGSLYAEELTTAVDADPAVLWSVIEGIGGERGWYGTTWVWAARGLLDRAVGGPGLRKGRRDPDRLAVGDQLDFWRVEAVEPGRLLRLRAEMKLPGQAWLELRVTDGKLVQRTLFYPHGLAGQAYWWAAKPLHALESRRLQAGIAATAAAAAGGNGG
ncbi:MAG TPA: SDR family oxidoreductase [Dermatophilaceae bacterium]|nr:SDR family oxidoreductase [Dermatophilaceae bacterium]